MKANYGCHNVFQQSSHQTGKHRASRDVIQYNCCGENTQTKCSLTYRSLYFQTFWCGQSAWKLIYIVWAFVVDLLQTFSAVSQVVSRKSLFVCLFVCFEKRSRTIYQEQQTASRPFWHCPVSWKSKQTNTPSLPFPSTHKHARTHTHQRTHQRLGRIWDSPGLQSAC